MDISKNSVTRESIRLDNAAQTTDMPRIQLMQAANINTETQELPRTNQETLALEKNNTAASPALISEIRNIVSVLEAHGVDCSDINSQLDKTPDSLTNHELRLIYKAFKHLAHQNKSTNKELGELCQLSYKKLRYFWFSYIRNIEAEHAYEKLKPYGEPGAYLGHAVSAGLNAGVGLGIAGTELGATSSGGLSLVKETAFSQDDEAFFYPGVNISLYSLSGGASVGAQLSQDLGVSASAGVAGRYFQQKGYEYGDVQDYVKTKGFIRVKRDPLSFKGKIAAFFKGKLTRDDYIKANQAAFNAEIRLKSLLTSLQTEITPSLSIAVPDRQLGDPYVVNGALFDLNAGVNAQLNLDLGGVTIAQGAGARIIQEAKYFDVDARAKFNLLDFEAEQENDESFDPDKPRNTVLTPSWLSKIKSFNQGEAFNVSDLKQSLMAYYECVTEYDWRQKEGREFSSKVELKALRQIKREIETRWGASGRHQLIQNMWMALVYLKHNNQIENEQDADLQSLIADLTKPRIKHNYERLKDIAFGDYIVPLKITDFRSEIQLSLSQFKGKVELLHRTRQHPNILREGKYLDLAITGEASVSFGALFGSDEFMSAISGFVGSVGLELPADFALGPDISVGGSVSYRTRFFKPKYTENEDYQGEKGWKRQFNRLLTSTFSGTGFSVSSPVTLGANLSGSLGCQSISTKLQKETVCADDPIYTLMRCLRFYRNSSLHNASQQKDANSLEWQLFYQERKAEIQQLFRNFANPEHPASKEIQYLATHYGEFDLSAFNQAMRDFNQDPSKEKAACLAFTQLAVNLADPIMKVHRKAWIRVNFDKGVDSGLSFGQKVRKKLRFSTAKEGNKTKENNKKESISLSAYSKTSESEADAEVQMTKL